MHFRYLSLCQWAAQNHSSGDIFLYKLSELFLIVLFFFVEGLAETIKKLKRIVKKNSHCDNGSVVIQQPKNSSRQKKNKNTKKKIVRKRKNPKPYNEETMAAAVEAVVNGDVGTVEAIKKYDLEKSGRTLYRHVKEKKRQEELGLLPKEKTNKKIKKEHIDHAAVYTYDRAAFTKESSIVDRRFINSAAVLKKADPRALSQCIMETKVDYDSRPENKVLETTVSAIDTMVSSIDKKVSERNDFFSYLCLRKVGV